MVVLQGLLPFSLLEDFEFWFRPDELKLIGYQRPEAASRGLHPWRIEAQLIRVAEGRGVLQKELSAVVRRVALKRPDRTRLPAEAGEASSASRNSKGRGVPSPLDAELIHCVETTRTTVESCLWTGDELIEDSSVPAETLVNLLLAPPGTSLARLRTSLIRLDALSHVLVWTRGARAPRGADDLEALGCAGAIDVIELPRSDRCSEGLTTFREERRQERPFKGVFCFVFFSDSA